ncbi:MAG: hypothetical protein IJO26_01670 [Clostridium sp.]|nr:hypothetical protein [Clostridium sp.]
MSNYFKEDLLKDNVKEKIKLLYKDIIIEDIKEEIEKSKNEVLENINDKGKNKKTNKEIINRLDQILMMVDMIESRDDKSIKSLIINNRISLVINCICVILLIIGFIV